MWFVTLYYDLTRYLLHKHDKYFHHVATVGIGQVMIHTTNEDNFVIRHILAIHSTTTSYLKVLRTKVMKITIILCRSLYQIQHRTSLAHPSDRANPDTH